MLSRSSRSIYTSFRNSTSHYTTSTAGSPKPFEKIPGPPIHPERGTTDDFIGRLQKTDLIQAANSYYLEYGPIVRLNNGGRDEVWIFDPTDMTHMFKNDDYNPTSLAGLLPPLLAWTQKSKKHLALTGPGSEQWRKERMAMQKDIFSPQVAATYTNYFNNPASEAAKVFNRDSFDKLMPFAAFDMFANGFLGKEFHATERSLDKNRERDDADIFVDAAMKALHLLVYLVVYRDNSPEKTAEFDSCMDTIYSYGDKFLKEAFSKEGFGKGQSYFERLVARHEMSLEQIISSLPGLLLASVDTTSYVTLWNLLNLGRYPHVQEKLYKEIINVVGDGPVTEKNIEKLEYMRHVSRESYRLTPVTSINSARILSRPIVLAGYEVPPGVIISCVSSPVQNDPRYVDSPNEFIPERWSKEEVLKRKGTPKEILDALVISKPFGTGPRMCMGARYAETEIKVFLCQLLRTWKFHFDPNQQKFSVALSTMTHAMPYPKMEMQQRK